MFTGVNNGYHWLVSSQEILGLRAHIVKTHPGLRVCFSMLDSSLPRPTRDEILNGWVLQGTVLIGPVLGAKFELPSDEFEEWYVLREPAFAGVSVETFVQNCGFTLVDPKILSQGRDPSWERDAFDFLVPVQERFWNQMETISPETFVSIGENCVVASRSAELIEKLVRIA